MPSENWLIIDDTRSIAAIHSADQETYLTTLSTDELQRLKHTEDMTDPFIDMWKSFFHHIEIAERKIQVVSVRIYQFGTGNMQPNFLIKVA